MGLPDEQERQALDKKPSRRMAWLTVRWTALRLRLIVWFALREEHRQLKRLGEAIATTVENAGTPATREEVAMHHRAISETELSIASSLGNDRADYSAVSPWIRPLVILRGLAERGILRHHRARVRVEHGTACGRLGAEAVLGTQGLAGAAGQFAAAARAARTKGEEAKAHEQSLLLPFGGAIVPAGVRRVGRECAGFSKSLFHTARGQMIPRAPALVGLLAGWWVAETFTDSQFSATLHSLGFGSGPRHAMRSDTYQALKFWLPLGAAALCSYAGSRISALVRSRYAPPQTDPVKPA